MKLGRALGVFAAFVILTFRKNGRKRPGTQHTARLLRRLAGDQKRIWLSPAAAIRGDAWKPTLCVIGATAALIALDPVTAPWFQRPTPRNLKSVRIINRLLSGKNMAVAINGLPVSLYLAGLLRGNAAMRTTAWLAVEAAADAEVVAIAMKSVDRRVRPAGIGPGGDFTRTWFLTKNHVAGCFPSGHTAAAFAVAATLAERYRSHRWASCLAYSFAGIVGFSRLLSLAHYPSDVFVGAVIGRTISRKIVLGR